MVVNLGLCGRKPRFVVVFMVVNLGLCGRKPRLRMVPRFIWS